MTFELSDPATPCPYAVGDPIVTVCGGDYDEDSDVTLPGELGKVTSVDRYALQGWTCGILFANGCWVFVDEKDGLLDPARYRKP